ncbi:MAG: hypothetical protein K8I82_08670 [Anaerolineae bacterium]|nr:hypothetical protein [Anaerolineae bacterium]
MKRILIALTVVMVALMSAGLAGAQEPEDLPRGEHPFLRMLVQLVSEETGLLPMEIVQQTRDGKTLAEIITENGGSVENVQAQIETAVDELLNTNFREAMRGQVLDGIVRRAVMDAVSDVLGQTLREILRDINDDQTLSDYITANAGDPAAVTADALEKLQTHVDGRVANGNMTQQEADTLLAEAEAKITEILNQPIERPVRRGR